MRRIAWMASMLLVVPLVTGAAQDEVIEEEVQEVTPLEELAALKEEIQKAQQEFFDLYQAAETEEEQQKLFEEKYVSPATFAPKFWAIADAHVGTEASLEAMLWLVDNASPQGKKRQKVLTRLLEHHMDSERIADACQRLSPSLDTEMFLRAAIEQSPFHSVKGQATYALAGHMNNMAGLSDTLASADDETRKSLAGYYGADLVEEMQTVSKDELLEESELLFEEVIEEYGELPHYKGSLRQAADSALFEMRNLAIGMTAPQIQGEDIDGVKFQLTDYRGKVIMLDFWGHW